MISGIHFGHYKSAVTSDLLSKIHTFFSHTAAHTSKPLRRWSKEHQVTLIKEVVNLKVNELIAALLVKTDYNWLFKLLVKNCFIPQAEITGLIPEGEINKR